MRAVRCIDGRPTVAEVAAPAGDGDCDLCEAGDYNRCPANLADIAGISRDGGMADEVLMWPEAVVPLPTGVDARDAWVEPIAIAVHGFRMVGLRGGMRVAVIGGGTIGQAALAVARLTGCETAVSARHDAQKEAAERLGAAPLSDEPYDVVVDAAAEAFAAASDRASGAIKVVLEP